MRTAENFRELSEVLAILAYLDILHQRKELKEINNVNNVFFFNRILQKSSCWRPCVHHLLRIAETFQKLKGRILGSGANIFLNISCISIFYSILFLSFFVKWRAFPFLETLVAGSIGALLFNLSLGFIELQAILWVHRQLAVRLCNIRLQSPYLSLLGDSLLCINAGNQVLVLLHVSFCWDRFSSDRQRKLLEEVKVSLSAAQLSMKSFATKKTLYEKVTLYAKPF